MHFGRFKRWDFNMLNAAACPNLSLSNQYWSLADDEFESQIRSACS